MHAKLKDMRRPGHEGTHIQSCFIMISMLVYVHRYCSNSMLASERSVSKQWFEWEKQCIKFLVLLHNCLHTDVVPLTRATHGQASGMIVEEIRCNGAERRLVNCSIRDQRDGECSHNEDAGVICGKV